MGHFQAITIETDREVTFTPNSANQGKGSNTIDNYYQFILKSALRGNFSLASEISGLVNNNSADSQQLQTHINTLWGSSSSSPIGYILKDNNITKNIDNILIKVSDEEKKYYWQWNDNNIQIQDKNNEVILNNLQIINVKQLNRIFINNFNQPGGGKLWINDEKEQQNASLIAPPIIISSESNFTKDSNNYFPVYLNNSAKLFFLDGAENTQSFQYTKSGSSYIIQRTYRFNKKERDKYYKSGTIIASDLEEKVLDRLLLDKKNYGDLYYSYALKNLVNRLAYQHHPSVKKYKETANKKIINQLGKGVDIENEILSQIQFKNPDDKLNTSINNEYKSSIREIANVNANKLPKKCNCFYYDNSGQLNGFISQVLIGEGGRSGGSGYPMRADKINEVKYGWVINIDQTKEELYLTRLSSYLFGLESEYYYDRTMPPEIKFDKNQASGLYPTNWSYQEESWFNYYKEFRSGAKRRNKPNVNIFPPRITNPKINNYKYRIDIKNSIDPSNAVKLDNVSYRVWKKYDSLSEKELVLGINENERIDAGSVMAESLRDFHIYSEMKSSSDITPRITAAKLSATAFAKYILKNDLQTQNQWKKDNEIASSVSVNASNLNTDQEWCHLFGHGDGGSEELGNFVSGSKHCNTEQLAIETGQRRVTQNNKIDKRIRDRITARITAYLFPNQGTWIAGQTYSQQELDKKLLSNIGNYKGIYSKTIEQKKSIFFESFDQNSQTRYRLKSKKDQAGVIDDNHLKTKFEELSTEIRNTKDTQLRKNLFKFRHNIEKHFFMYLPLARWMRYKLYFDGKKVFDHIYDAQSESMNIHECEILAQTVERVLYKAIGKWNDYKNKIKELSVNLVPIEEEFEWLKKIHTFSSTNDTDLNRIKEITKQIKTNFSALTKIQGDTTKYNQFITSLENKSNSLTPDSDSPPPSKQPKISFSDWQLLTNWEYIKAQYEKGNFYNELFSI